MPATYEPIATTTVVTPASTITFSSITSAYTDLKLVLVASSTLSASPRIQFNSDTGTNYSRTTIYGDGATAASSRSTGFASIGLTTTSLSLTIPTMISIDLFSYAGSTYKTILSAETNDQNGSGAVSRTVGLWRSTSAITSIDLSLNTSTFTTGTTATLYGILKA
jgi:hypothetical protein